ncbi:MAG: hypothetical protein Fur0032_11290 [Terrimicrobiaceae bacterium]
MADFAGFFSLNAKILYWIFLAPFRRRRGLDFSAMFQQSVKIGVQAVPMVALTSFTIGLTLAMLGAQELSRMGATSYVPDLVGIAMLRELGPIIVAVVVIGRSGSAVTAEIGTMKVSEEIEALEVMSINPIRFLVVPRFLALMIMMPVLTVFGNYLGFVGGWVICHFSLNMSTFAYILRIVDSSSSMDLISGMVKSFSFAWIIATISCLKGLSVTGGAEGVGRNTTASVVQSILWMLIANALLTAGFFVLE